MTMRNRPFDYEVRWSQMRRKATLRRQPRRVRPSVVLYRKKGGGRSRPQLTMHGLPRRTDLKDYACAGELNQWTIRWIDKTGRTARSAAGIPHRPVIDDIGAAVRPESEVGRPV